MVKRKRDDDCNISPAINLPENHIICNDPPCNGLLIEVHLYPSHVEQHHDNICIKCGKNLPTQRLLERHQDEVHNPFK
ncbi:uncharacterized protein Ecym_3479 [Eremothecium cymbalariae DBVPG|uniref:C2H2-type domain-containing protein n=1 Tax=Eremothecium cymbalariae (strain CBS 270.75 / DBVPG 7215 / KCTC 17166 / NRRL Y-17582) TaxID=931890 RepID=G8JS43_ERECY|nr:Hypothetical protein Ecym_3479 [Eremothecium cymbalariae DBVPG\